MDQEYFFISMLDPISKKDRQYINAPLMQHFVGCLRTDESAAHQIHSYYNDFENWLLPS